MHCSYLCHDQSIGDGERGKEGTERGHEHVGDSSTLGGMATVVKIRSEINEQTAASWYKHEPALVARVATKEELDRDGVKPGEAKPGAGHEHKH